MPRIPVGEPGWENQLKLIPRREMRVELLIVFYRV
jgi:hypothetical protein